MAKKKHLFNYQGWFDHEVTAFVDAGANPDVIRLECTSFKPLLRAVYGEFTTTGTARTCGQVNFFTVQNNIPCQRVFLTMNTAYSAGNSITLVFNPTLKGKTATIVVTNNVT
jgi:hypothetical protein